MKTLLLALLLVLLVGGNALANNCRKGQPCGSTCISWEVTCHVGGGTSGGTSQDPEIPTGAWVAIGVGGVVVVGVLIWALTKGQEIKGTTHPHLPSTGRLKDGARCVTNPQCQSGLCGNVKGTRRCGIPPDESHFNLTPKFDMAVSLDGFAFVGFWDF
jgi:hypothetical protein